MGVFDIGIKRSAILPPIILMLIVVMILKFLNCMWVMEDVDIGLLRPSNLPLAILDCIILVTMEEVDIGLKRPSTIPISIVEQELMLTGEADIGLISATITTITQLVMVYCRVYQPIRSITILFTI